MKEVRQSWIVRMQCLVIKDVITKPCTRQEAESDPFGFAEDEVERDLQDWSVRDIEPNT